MQKPVLRQLTSLIRPWGWRMVAAILLGSGTILAGIGLMASSGYLVSAAALQPPILDLMIVFVSVRFFGISRAALRYAERMLSHDTTFRLLMHLRVHSFKMISSLPACRLMGYRSGSLLGSITSDIDELKNFYIRVVTPVVIAGTVIAAITIFLLQFHPVAAWTTLCLLTINVILVPVVIRRLARGLGIRQVNLRSKLHHLWIEQCQGMEEIRLFGMQHRWQHSVSDLAGESARLEKRQSMITGFQDSLHNWLIYIAIIAALWATIPSVLSGQLPGVLLAMILLAIMASFEAAQNIGSAFQYLESTEKAASNLMQLQSSGTSCNGNSVKSNNASIETEKRNSEVCFDSLEFRHVSFSYDIQPIFEDLSFRIPAKSHIAIAGQTGSGKSTIVNLILGFYQPNEGEIFLNGKNIKLTEPDAVRSGISVVDQSTYIFNDTVRNNLLAVSPNIMDKQLINVLERVELGEWFNNLHGGLDTVLNEHGKRMSGGERQRLAVARAMLKDSKFWILDEPTAHLDTMTERSLIRTIREQTTDKTVLWITHRLVGMEHFNKILVLNDGKISEHGSHSSLMRIKGRYATLVNIQNDYLFQSN